MPELRSSAFPLGETSLHLLHTRDGDMFVTADLAVKLFDSAPATFAEFVRANRYVRVNATERAVVRLCASLGIPPETAGGNKPVSFAAVAVARAETTADGPNERDAFANAATEPRGAVTLLPEKTVLAILEDRREPRRAARFRETAARRSFVAAQRLAKRGEHADALPLALDAVRRVQDIRETPRARRAAAEADRKAARRDRRDEASASASAADGTYAPHVALFEPYLLAATITLALDKTYACENLLGLASWIALRRGDAVPEARRARLQRLRGELRLRQGRKADALEAFASAAAHAEEAAGPQTPRVALELFKLADAFREEGASVSSPAANAGAREGPSPETRDEESDAAAKPRNPPSPSSRTSDDHARACLRKASRFDASAAKIWLVAAADALGLLEVSSAGAGAVAAYVSLAETALSPESRVSFADLESEALQEASEALGRIATRESRGSDAGAREVAATASLARGLVLFVARERRRRPEALEAKEESDLDSDKDEDETSDALFAATFEEAVACVAEAIAAFPPSANGAAFARAVLERWSGESNA